MKFRNRKCKRERREKRAVSAYSKRITDNMHHFTPRLACQETWVPARLSSADPKRLPSLLSSSSSSILPVPVPLVLGDMRAKMSSRPPTARLPPEGPAGYSTA